VLEKWRQCVPQLHCNGWWVVGAFIWHSVEMTECWIFFDGTTARGGGPGLLYNTPPSLSIPCSVSLFVYFHLSQVLALLTCCILCPFIFVRFIIIIIILGISFMQDIYTYIPETNHVPREHCVAAILM
jgi:hypothetical protein